MDGKILLLFGFGLALLCTTVSAKRSPIIFIPGKGGSQIEARINKDQEQAESSECPIVKPWTRIWLDVWQFLWPGQLDCWAENFKLQYDPVTKKSRTTPGVTFRIPGFGETTSVEYVDDSWAAYLLGNFAAYLVFVCDELTTWGYARGKDIRAAPYDFRFAPHNQDEYFGKLRELVEETYRMNENTRVTLLAHSMGGIYGQYFLHTVDQAWKDEFIHAFVPVNTPWKGTVIISNLYTSGYNWGITPIDRGVLKMQMNTWETGVMLLPQEDAWETDAVLVRTPTRNYTAHDYDDYFRDANITFARELFENIRHSSYDMDHPGVDTYCVYSYGLDTPNELVYDEGDFPYGHATMIYGPGDGTVNLKSLEFCKKWPRGQSSHRIKVEAFEGVPHIDLLFNEVFYKMFKEVVSNA